MHPESLSIQSSLTVKKSIAQLNMICAPFRRTSMNACSHVPTRPPRTDHISNITPNKHPTKAHPHPEEERTHQKEATKRNQRMAQTLYPRGTVKKIIKAHSNRPLSKNVDILVRPRTSLSCPSLRAAVLTFG